MNKSQNITIENAVLEQNNPQIGFVEIKRDDLKNLAELVTQRQKNPKFMRFLKETPMTRQQNWQIFLREIDTENTKFLGIKLDGISDLVGFLLFHNFEKEKGILELGFRIDPQNQSRGVCTQAVKQSLNKILNIEAIEEIIGWHSAWNKGSFNVFKNSGFQLEKFLANQTFLPNIGEITDDFKRRINQTLLESPEALELENKKLVIKGLEKHNLFLDL